MAFLGIRVPSECGRLLKGLEVSGEKESPSEYHITILCFEDNWPLEKIAKTIKVVQPIIAETESFLVKTSKVSHFDATENKPTPIIAPIDSSELHDLHKKLSKAFDKAGIPFKKTFKEFNPHITLAYSDDGHDDYKMDRKVEFYVHEIVLWGGDNGDDRLFITMPVKGPERQKHALLLDRAKLFRKLAECPSGVAKLSRNRRLSDR